jgi:serine/threonine-protein kinase
VTAGETDLVGQTIDGKYRVETLLGRGGMGAVYRAVHLGTDRVVALKVVAPALAGQPEYLARFSREARACGRLRHPGIVDVTDFGIATHEGRPLAYLVMEFLDGSTLADVLQDQPRPPLPWVIDILKQCVPRLKKLARQGILHLDLKPENIWLEPNRRGGYSIKVLDFGLAKLEQDLRIGQDSRIGQDLRIGPAAAHGTMHTLVAPESDATFARTIDTAVSSVSGTPAYMSPEQTRGEGGVIAYRMIAGRLPFEGTVNDVLEAQLTKEAPPLRSVRPDVHADAARLIAAARGHAGRGPRRGNGESMDHIWDRIKR